MPIGKCKICGETGSVFCTDDNSIVCVEHATTFPLKWDCDNCGEICIVGTDNVSFRNFIHERVDNNVAINCFYCIWGETSSKQKTIISPNTPTVNDEIPKFYAIAWVSFDVGFDLPMLDCNINVELVTPQKIGNSWRKWFIDIVALVTKHCTFTDGHILVRLLGLAIAVDTCTNKK